MQEAAAAVLIIIGSCFIGGCAAIDDARQDINDNARQFEQEYQKARDKYLELRPRIKRDLSLLFGTDESGDIDTDAVRIENYPEDGKPGLQDLVYDRFDSFSEDEKERLRDANKEAKELYQKLVEIDQKLQSKDKDVRELLSKIKSVTDEGLTSGGALKALTEFAKVAGEVYIKTQS